MKRLFCLCLALMLCLMLFGCMEDSNTDDKSSYTKETVSTKGNVIVSGEITDKTNDGTLVLSVSYSSADTELGHTVDVITDDADEWCVGDRINVYFSEIERPDDSAQNIRIIANEIENVPDIMPAPEKPIIYFYPEVPTLCSARVILDGKLTCTYPEHGEDGWKDFTAYPDGTLIFPDGKEYYALYWEGLQNTEWDFSKGFCVRGEDTAKFLEWALEKQGLTPREANEFIIYWLPLMQDNPYNVISFQTSAYKDSAILDIAPMPDSMLRVFMAYYPTDTEIDIEPQTFEPFVRKGFTVVEWGGSRVEMP